nr:protein msta-like [Leptinotarsa decemlineata]XP_023023437.1 protein msta-like [Leptinotarsa decemlineata]XP_023023444.1 protein msta-like [Leptinotarsa decemlineata]
MNSRRTKEKLVHIINGYLERNGIIEKEASWEIRESTMGGFGIFAKKDIEVGEIIFHDLPILFGPRCQVGTTTTTCIGCFSNSNLNKCINKCGLLLCQTCQNSPNHYKDCTLIQRFRDGRDLGNSTSEVTRCLTPLRSLLLSEEDLEVVRNLKYHSGRQHGEEVRIIKEVLKLDLSEEVQEFLMFVCSIMDANAFEVVAQHGDNQVSMRGLYPLGSLANHRCYPNATHMFDDKHRMVVRASVFIKKDTEIFHSYLRLIWGTITRMFHLRNTKHFICSCERCVDPTEFGTYMSAILCESCRGNVIPINPLKHSQWRCEDCQKAVPLKDVARVFSLIGSTLRGLDDSDFKYIYSFLTKKLTSMLPQYGEVIVELKYKMIWILGYKEGYQWKDLTMDLLKLKREYCQNILDLLKKLKIGQCHLRGLLLYEAYLCLEEMKLRQSSNVDEKVSDEDSNGYLEEAADILRFSASAPEIIRQKWQSKGPNNND